MMTITVTIIIKNWFCITKQATKLINYKNNFLAKQINKLINNKNTFCQNKLLN